MPAPPAKRRRGAASADEAATKDGDAMDVEPQVAENIVTESNSRPKRSAASSKSSETAAAPVAQPAAKPSAATAAVVPAAPAQTIAAPMQQNAFTLLWVQCSGCDGWEHWHCAGYSQSKPPPETHTCAVCDKLVPRPAVEDDNLCLRCGYTTSRAALQAAAAAAAGAGGAAECTPPQNKRKPAGLNPLQTPERTSDGFLIPTPKHPRPSSATSASSMSLSIDVDLDPLMDIQLPEMRTPFSVRSNKSTMIHTVIADAVANPEHAEKVITSLSTDDARINMEEENGWTPLLQACGQPDKSHHAIFVKLARLLMEREADIEAEDKEGLRALHWAASVNNHEIVKMLIAQGVELDAQCNLGETALHKASRFGAVQSLRLLLDTSANHKIRNYEFQTALDVAGLNRGVTIGTKKNASRKEILTKKEDQRTLVLHHADCMDHANTREDHQESPFRIKATMAKLMSHRQFSDVELVMTNDFDKAKWEDVLRAHSSKYVAFVQSLADAVAVVGSEPVAFTPRVQRNVFRTPMAQVKDPTACDTSFSRGSLGAALRAAGSVVAAIDSVIDGQHRNAFCCVRPPGHHAGPEGLPPDCVSCGFCIFNNVAIGALYGLEVRKLQRVAIVDLDVHHGNGTEEIVRKYAASKAEPNNNIFFYSVHLYLKIEKTEKTEKYDFYPGSGAKDDMRINAVNSAMPPMWFKGVDAFRKQQLIVAERMKAIYGDTSVSMNTTTSTGDAASSSGVGADTDAKAGVVGAHFGADVADGTADSTANGTANGTAGDGDDRVKREILPDTTDAASAPSLQMCDSTDAAAGGTPTANRDSTVADAVPATREGSVLSAGGDAASSASDKSLTPKLSATPLQDAPIDEGADFPLSPPMLVKDRSSGGTGDTSAPSAVEAAKPVDGGRSTRSRATTTTASATTTATAGAASKDSPAANAPAAAGGRASRSGRGKAANGDEEDGGTALGQKDKGDASKDKDGGTTQPRKRKLSARALEAKEKAEKTDEEAQGATGAGGGGGGGGGAGAKGGRKDQRDRGKSPAHSPAKQAPVKLEPTGRKEFRRHITQSLIPALRAFGPSMVLISAGFDAGKGDVGNGNVLSDSYEPGMDLEPLDFEWATAQIRNVANVTCDGRVVSVLEGGYGHFEIDKSNPSMCVISRNSLAENCCAHVRAMVGR